MNSMSLNRFFGKFIVFASFVVISLVVVFLISKLLYYMNTGAKEKIFVSDYIEQHDNFSPKITIDLSDEDLNIKPDKIQLEKLTRDYLNARFARDLSLKNNEDIGLTDYFLKPLFYRFKQNIKTNQEQENKIESTSLSHHLKFHYFSHDAMFTVFTDSASEEYTRLYSKNKPFHSFYSSNNYKIVMKLEGSNWKVNFMEKYNSKIIPIFKKKKDTTSGYDSTKWMEIRQDTFFLNNQVYSIKGINYYPQKTPWHDFWKKFDEKIVEKDLKFMSKSGFNTLRIFIPYNEFLNENEYKKNYPKLLKFVDLCEKHNLKIIATLFDFYSNFSTQDWYHCDQYMQQVMVPLAKNPTIMAWDLKNEPDIDYNYHPKEYITAWLQFVIKQSHIYSPKQFITIGWSNLDEAVLYENQLDFLAPHFYLTPVEFSKKYESFKKQVSKKPIVIAEYGTHSYNSTYFPNSKTREDQENYYKLMYKFFDEQKVAHSMVWTLYDFTYVPTDVVGNLPWRKKLQENYGLIMKNGAIKPAFYIVAPNKDFHPKKKNNIREFNLFYFSLTFCVFVAFLVLFLIAYIKVRNDLKK